jgi:hypothetical protein
MMAGQLTRTVGLQVHSIRKNHTLPAGLPARFRSYGLSQREARPENRDCYVQYLILQRKSESESQAVLHWQAALSQCCSHWHTVTAV